MTDNKRITKNLILGHNTPRHPPSKKTVPKTIIKRFLKGVTKWSLIKICIFVLFVPKEVLFCVLTEFYMSQYLKASLQGLNGSYSIIWNSFLSWYRSYAQACILLILTFSRGEWNNILQCVPSIFSNLKNNFPELEIWLKKCFLRKYRKMSRPLTRGEKYKILKSPLKGNSLQRLPTR